MGQATVDYFGLSVVEKAVASYFAKHGVTEQVRDELLAMEREDGEAFFSMVSEFVENAY
jgi:hypothetical protein